MTHDEAEKLARELYETARGFSTSYDRKVETLSAHILSGDMRRDIENAAYERALQQCTDMGQAGRVIRKRIRSLIQPPAQKENGK